MKYMIVKSLALLVGVAGMTLSVHAIPIPNGSEVDMSGTATLDSTFLGLATKATAFSSVTVGGAPSGGYGGVATGTPVTWNPFGWNPTTTPVSPLWTMLAGAYTFTLNTITVATQNNTFLNLSGTGIATAPGFDPTGGSWTFTISNSTGGSSPNFQFTFANSQVTVPDGGVTAMLLGSALSVLGLIRRKLA
jgi:hypothetical protein